jgi:pyocin large subunit-like protein
MNKKIIALIFFIALAVGSVGVEKLGSLHPNLPPHVGKESIVYDTSRIWSKGPTGNAAENAARHFKKHGHEFGFKTEAEYVAAAVQFTTEPLPEGVLKNIQKDGDTAYYNPKTAEYAVKSKKGFIRTYFKLNPQIHGFQSNTDYFNAQAGVGAPPAANDNIRK